MCARGGIEHCRLFAVFPSHCFYTVFKYMRLKWMHFKIALHTHSLAHTHRLYVYFYPHNACFRCLHKMQRKVNSWKSYGKKGASERDTNKSMELYYRRARMVNCTKLCAAWRRTHTHAHQFTSSSLLLTPANGERRRKKQQQQRQRQRNERMCARWWS